MEQQQIDKQVFVEIQLGVSPENSQEWNLSYMVSMSLPAYLAQNYAASTSGSEGHMHFCPEGSLLSVSRTREGGPTLGDTNAAIAYRTCLPRDRS